MSHPDRIFQRHAVHTAAKDHGPCDICKQPIVKGQQYKGLVCKLTGEAGKYVTHVKSHVACPEPQHPGAPRPLPGAGA